MNGIDDDNPKKRTSHEIGCDISLLAADELTARIALLEAEIERLKAERAAKAAGRLAAESLFKK
ncbi:MAG: hypothetical protein BGO05_13700 [Rhizobiales bacterium 63-7]|uniref:DUF1192 domain-containing protein n=1 Tax=Rhizobium sp. YJ-22 TaxID=3037556 RepID=UPI000927D57E|nr:DUF1192 domain-containing protein [Rhizobium sp. YJ-22]MBN9033093.1 DUF1192 domain-containing protein [Hyphomicrobiales bacterium]MDG3578732.1 DUF1192 domain-containing protein [Rhizobium sp. YJ-22]OJU71524.1 MAG: hypothetical protein BGO05_13700 [Rhizobiales bacterium 63-7]